MRPQFVSEKLKEIQQQQESKSSWLQSLVSTVKSKLTKLKSYIRGEEDIPIPCIHIYLDYYFKLLTGKVYANKNVDPSTISNTIVAIYHSLHKPYFNYDFGPRIVTINNTKTVSVHCVYP